MNNSYKSFLKVEERGKIDLFKLYFKNPQNHVSSDPITSEVNTFSMPKYLTPTETGFYARKKDILYNISNTQTFEVTNQNKVLRKLVEDDSILLVKMENKEYSPIGDHRYDIQKVIHDYNARAANKKIESEVVIYRRSKKQASKSVSIYFKGELIGELGPNHLVQTSIDNILDFEVCTEKKNCFQFYGISGQTNYLEVIYSAKETEPAIQMVNSEVGEFYSKKVQYFMDKASLKSKKGD